MKRFRRGVPIRIGMAVVVLACLALPHAVRAADGAAEATSGRRAVEVLVAGPADDAHALQTSLRELLDRLALDLRVIRLEAPDAALALREPAPDVVARFSADLRASDLVTVTMLERSPTVGRARSVARRGSRALQIEEAAYIIHVATESKLSSEAQHLSMEDGASDGARTARPATTPFHGDLAGGTRRPFDEDEARGYRIDLATFALAGTVAADAGAVFGGGVGAEWAKSERWFPHLWLFAAYHLPFGRDVLPVELHAGIWSFRAIPTLTLMTSSRASLHAGVGAGADLFVLSSGASSAFARVSAGRVDASPILQALAVVRVALNDSSCLFLGTDLDVDLRPRAYVVTGSRGETTDLIRPNRWRPSLLVGFTFNLFASAGQ